MLKFAMYQHLFILYIAMAWFNNLFQFKCQITYLFVKRFCVFSIVAFVLNYFIGIIYIYQLRIIYINAVKHCTHQAKSVIVAWIIHRN